MDPAAPETVVVATPRSAGIDWPAILAGAVIAAALGVLFHIFGFALGLSSVAVGDGRNSFDVWIIVTSLWTVVTMVLTYMTGGYIAARMRRRGEGFSDEEVSIRDGVHGLVVWGLGTLAMVWILVGLLGAAGQTAGTVAGAAVEGAGTVLASGAKAAGNAISATATSPDQDKAAIGWIGDTLSRPGPAAFGPPEGGIDPAELTRQSGAILANVARTGEISDEDRSFLTAATVRVTGVTPTEAEARTEAAVTAAQSLRAEAQTLAATAEAEAIRVAETARKSAILTAFLVAATSLAAAAASVAGAVHGGHHRDANRFFRGLGYRLLY